MWQSQRLPFRWGLRDDSLASRTCRRFDSVDSFLRYSGKLVGAIGLREFQNVAFDFGFVDQTVHGVLSYSECFRFRGIESKRIPQAVTLQNARDLVHGRMD